MTFLDRHNIFLKVLFPPLHVRALACDRQTEPSSVQIWNLVIWQVPVLQRYRHVLKNKINTLNLKMLFSLV